MIDPESYVGRQEVQRDWSDRDRMVRLKEDGPGIDARIETLRAIKRLSRKIRKNGAVTIAAVSSRPKCTVKLLGPRVASGPLDRQITELKVRAKVHNRFSQIGPPTTIRIA